uniref:Uncharacterized protein n=1 Tax=Anguilla anguilla TaxID=7936 RepID=A0A0E9XZK0_ANGAN
MSWQSDMGKKMMNHQMG